MGSEEKLIWEYLDGTLSQKEKAKVQIRLEADASFRGLYESQQKLHIGLQRIEKEKAPDFILSNIMLSLKNETIYHAETTKFTGLKYFSALFIALNFILIVWGVSSAPTGAGSGSLDKKLKDLYEPLMNFDLAHAIALPAQQMMLYGVTIGLLLILFWGDFIYSRLRTVKNR